ncbi:hypothetical protein GOBAR_AA00267 [Gossypium barbadense]|uniref:SWIM-type domain-containing protein n=1 Tax=Gossypium barbadense TaxID=3634 RepID=A0A2P5YXP3_GOSBA|nr:hypothetical protein GOBAR_AA00267 [Gossypium barbadense]
MEVPMFSSSMEYSTPARHFVSGWNMHLSGLMFDAGNTYWGMTSTSSGWQSTSDWRRCETSIRRDDVLPTKSTGKRTFYVAHDDGSDNESDADPPREASLDGAEVALFSEPEPVLTIPEDVEGDDALEFPDLPHRRRDHTSSSLDLGELEVGKEFSNNDSFLGALKQHSIMNGVNYNVVKSKSNKFEAKCAVQDGTCSWKIMASLRKKTGLWEIKKYKGPHTCVAGYEISNDRFHEMLAVLHSINEESANYLYNIPFEQWTQAYDSGLRYGHMTSNLAKCINSVLKGTCYLSITSVVIETYFHLAALFSKRAASYKGQMQEGRVWYAKVLQEINKAKARTNTMHTVCHDRNNLWFRVTEFDRLHEGIIGRQYRVHLRNRICDCGRFDALRYPCTHVIAACQNLRLDPMSYVDKVYKLKTMYNVWKHVFPPVPDEHNWPHVLLAPFKLLPDRELRRKPKGRPCSTRIRTNIDIEK